MHFFHVHWTEPFGSGKEVEIVTSPAQEIVEKPSEHVQNDVVDNKDVNISLQNIEIEENENEKDPGVNEALKVKDAPELQPFFKMLRMGVPLEAVKLKMSRENLNPNLLDIPDSDYNGWYQIHMLK